MFVMMSETRGNIAFMSLTDCTANPNSSSVRAILKNERYIEMVKNGLVPANSVIKVTQHQ